MGQLAAIGRKRGKRVSYYYKRQKKGAGQLEAIGRKMIREWRGRGVKAVMGG